MRCLRQLPPSLHGLFSGRCLLPHLASFLSFTHQPRPTGSLKRSRLQCFSSTAGQPPLASSPAPALDPRETRVATVPNCMTLLRLLLSPYLGYQILTGAYLASGGLFLGLCFLDVADGWVARTFDQESKLGSYLDPLADKVMLVCAAVPLCSVGALPLPLVALWAARDAAIVAGGLYLRAATRPRAVPFFHMTHASVPTVQPTGLSKANTALQAALATAALGSLVALEGLGEGGLLAAGLQHLAALGLDSSSAAAQALQQAAAQGGGFQAACWLSAGTTLLSWADYTHKQYSGLQQWRAAAALEGK